MNIFAHDTGYEHVEQIATANESTRSVMIIGVIIVVFVAICGVLYWDQSRRKK